MPKSLGQVFYDAMRKEWFDSLGEAAPLVKGGPPKWESLDPKDQYAYDLAATEAAFAKENKPEVLVNKLIETGVLVHKGMFTRWRDFHPGGRKNYLAGIKALEEYTQG